eukprot:Blabericola_migrator_1__740@NODE_1184_length_5189_cov_182_323702_g63_i1_p7_GENE_NODE_1184_length_5189_cov_182_323702_g63_i1NODE_1184_length_5189_cov_182_323702_g63_i1_p7_ORF_typecomplete_len119_score18_42DUF4918/PF16265_5/0_11_NODE_1184_length_5189_cov_182_323702_g63_i16891045
MRVVPPSVLCFKTIIFYQINRCKKSFRLTLEQTEELKSLLDRLHPESPLELLAKTAFIDQHSSAEIYELAKEIDDPNHFFQLHVMTTAVVCWLVGMRHSGSENGTVLAFIQSSLRWLE